MINVNSVYLQVRALSRKDEAGYHSSDDFNAQQRLAQALLYDWYFARYERDQRVPDSLKPFLREVILPISSGEVSLPSDYRHRVEVAAGYNAAGTITYYPCRHLHGNEEVGTERSYVRRPSAEKRRFYHTIKSDALKILPTSFNGVVRLKYLAVPADAVWGSIVDADNNIEDYDAGTSTDFEWEAMDETNLVDIMLYLKGIQARQSELLEWVASKNSIIKNQP